MRLAVLCLFLIYASSSLGVEVLDENSDAKRLHDDLLNQYFVICPMSNESDILSVTVDLGELELIGEDKPNLIMTTDLAVELKFIQYKLQWNPDEYGGLEILDVPLGQTFHTDVTVFNKPAGNCDVMLMKNVSLKYTGEVFSQTPEVFGMLCEYNRSFRLNERDELNCFMKFGSGIFSDSQVDLKTNDPLKGRGFLPIGIGLKEYGYNSGDDILEEPANENDECYCITKRNKVPAVKPRLTIGQRISGIKNVYISNFVISSVALTFMTVFESYLPSDIAEKNSFSIPCVALIIVFDLTEIILPDYLVIPSFDKYILFATDFGLLVVRFILMDYFRRRKNNQPQLLPNIEET